jgi:hypothetical protein
VTSSSGLHHYEIIGLGDQTRGKVSSIMLNANQNAVDVGRVECGPCLRHHFCSLGDPEVRHNIGSVMRGAAMRCRSQRGSNFSVP